ncbi:discoidin domain-containing protein [Paenibacillus sp.]|uniref:discoidin domain-containing protein n=1 Tax=Paenibacillus sp. TaxID=58172 RepID=UPI002D4A699C|nr:discoidin domain-containing protein [Paenibacillus sp.]HZG56038.1 discoidin domain-containing protein [Paenibacillus sp.]
MRRGGNKGCKALLAFALTASALAYAGPMDRAEAANVYVDTVAEIQAALTSAQPGDTILVAPGTYEDPTADTVGLRSAYFYSTVDGTSSAPITIRSQDPANPAILKGGDIAQIGYTLYITGDYWRIEDIHVTHGQKGIILDNSNHTVIDGARVYHTGQEAIHVRDGSSNVIIENSFVDDTGATLDATDMGFAEGIYIGSDRSTWDVNEGQSGSSVEPGYGYDRMVMNTIVRNNTTGSLVRAEPMDIKEGAGGTLVEGNTFLGGGIVGDTYNFADSFIDVKGYNTTIRNNVFYRQNNSNIDNDIAEVNRTSTNPWCPSNETSNQSLTNTGDGNTYTNNTFHAGDPPPGEEPPPPTGGSLVLPDWSEAGYKGGQSLPTGGTVVDLTTKGIAANDGNDDTAELQAVIDGIRSGSLTVNGSPVSENNRAILQLPAGQIDLSGFIRMDASWVTLRGAGSDPNTGTKIVFKPASTYVSDNGLPVIDGRLWPGYGAFRVEDREKHPNDTNYEGSINFHWLSGVRVASGGGGSKGGTTVQVASGEGDRFSVGDTIYVGAANTVEFYQSMGAPQEYWINQHMRSQMFKVTGVSGDTLTIDKPLEFDIPYSNGGDILGTTYYSRVMPVKTVEGVGFENFYFTQDISYTPYSHKNSNDYDAVSNPNGVGLKYTNEAPEYALHAIVFKWAANGWVKGIRTHMTGSHPIVTEFARHMEFRDNVLFGAWNKGKGGHGYLRGSKLYDSIIANNTVDRIRHVTLQWSATGNVVTGNSFSVDMNLHGGWERNNLIERNTIVIPYLHQSWGEGEGGAEPEGGTWYPIWYGAGPHASKWSGATGENNVFFNNNMQKQQSAGAAYTSYAPYDQTNRIYQIGWDGSGWAHLEKPDGTLIGTWTYNETVDFSASPNSGVYDCYTFSGASLLGAGTATLDCGGGGGGGDTQAPTAPSGLTATAVSSSAIDLAWTASSDNVGVAGYRVYRNGTLVGTVSGTSYSDTGLTASTTYNYTVRAFDAAGNVSGDSATASATTQSSGGGGTSAKLTIAAVTASSYQSGNEPGDSIDGSLSTRWSAEGDGQWIQYDLGSSYTIDLVKIAFYNGASRTTAIDILLSTNGTSWTQAFSGSSSGTTTALETFDFADASARYVRIVGHGNSDNLWNSITEVEIWGYGSGSGGDTQAPTAPTGLTATAASSSAINLAWTASSDNVGVAQYEVYRGSTLVGTTTGTSYSDTGLAASTTYTYTVRAKDAAGNVSPASGSASATTLSSTPPPTSALKLLYQEGDGGTTGDNDIRPYFTIVNDGTTSIPLSELKIRYYYKKESSGSQTATIDFATIGKSYVTGTIHSYSPATSTADAYLEVGFTSGAGSLAAGADTGNIKTRINNADWSNFNESNDYSYGPSFTSYGEFSNVTMYHNGVLVWGVEP